MTRVMGVIICFLLIFGFYGVFVELERIIVLLE